MANGNEYDGPLPRWFVRSVVIAAFGLLGTVGGAIWWAATLSADLRNIQDSLNSTLERQAQDLVRLQKQHDKEFEELSDQVGELDLRLQYMDKRLEVIKDRTGMRDLP